MRSISKLETQVVDDRWSSLAKTKEGMRDIFVRFEGLGKRVQKLPHRRRCFNVEEDAISRGETYGEMLSLRCSHRHLRKVRPAELFYCTRLYLLLCMIDFEHGGTMVSVFIAKAFRGDRGIRLLEILHL